MTINANTSLIVNQPITTGTGNAGTLKIGSGVTLNAATTAGAGTTITLNRIDVNDPPDSATNLIVMAQNTIATPSSHVFTVGDFPFSEPIDSPPNAFNGVVITTTPGLGSLTFFNGIADVAVTPGQTITLADIVEAVEGPIANVRGIGPEQVEYAGSSERLREVWIAMRANLRAVLENVTVGDVARGELPLSVEELASNPDAWQPH